MAIELIPYLADTWSQKKGEPQKIKTILLAAGLGSRMLPLTGHHIPKPMFPLGGHVPMIESWVRKSIESGIMDISMNLCVLGSTIRNYFDSGAKYGANVTYVEEETPSGTLGGVCKQALGKTARQVCVDEKIPLIEPFNGSTVFVISGDIVSNFGAEQLEQLYEIHKQKGAAFTIILTPVPWEKRGEFGTVELESPEMLKSLFSQSGQIKEFREKDSNAPTNLNNASIYIIEMELIKELEKFRTEARLDIKKPFYDFGKQVFRTMLGKPDDVKLPADFSLWGVQYDGAWFDVGRKRDYLHVNEELLKGKLEFNIPYEKLPWGYLGTNTKIDFPGVKIVPPVVIGNDCVIESETVIGPYAVIGDEWKIGKGSQICHSVLWPHYEYYTQNDKKINIEEWKLRDLHEVGGGVTIDTSIVVGGKIEEDVLQKTVDVKEGGQIMLYDIDWVPDKKRV
jgi:mannose-1-phosphate guanylyltransferase/phosphomannomutase